MTELERLEKEWARMCAENPEQAEHFASILRGEKQSTGSPKQQERRIPHVNCEKPLERRATPMTDEEKHRLGCEGVLSYFRGVAEEKGWTDGEGNC